MPIYFDNNATTRLDPRVLEAMLPYLSGPYGNASSLHRFGRMARDAVETARAQVAALVSQILGQAVAPDQPLIACGLDSLMAMDLRNRLNRRFGIGLGLADLMGGADIAGLVDAVERAVTADDAMEEVTL